MTEPAGDVKLSLPTDATVETKKTTVIFKVFCPEMKIIHLNQNKVEKFLTPIWNDIIYVTRGKPGLG